MVYPLKELEAGKQWENPQIEENNEGEKVNNLKIKNVIIKVENEWINPKDKYDDFKFNQLDSERID